MKKPISNAIAISVIIVVAFLAVAYSVFYVVSAERLKKEYAREMNSGKEKESPKTHEPENARNEDIKNDVRNKCKKLGFGSVADRFVSRKFEFLSGRSDLIANGVINDLSDIVNTEIEIFSLIMMDDADAWKKRAIKKFGNDKKEMAYISVWSFAADYIIEVKKILKNNRYIGEFEYKKLASEAKMKVFNSLSKKDKAENIF